jgi:glutamin-(asparagin-)ase
LFNLRTVAPMEILHKPKVVLLGTGGTIAGRAASATDVASYAAAVIGIKEILATVPELNSIANVDPRQLMNIGSKNLTDEDIVKIGKAVQNIVAEPDVDGVVVAHGTDTLEETGYFLNLAINASKPVVVVGAMRPATSLSADGPLNLYDAVRTAASSEAAGKGVLLVMNGSIFSARDATKRDTYRPHAFASPYGPLGLVTEARVAFYRAPTRRHTTSSEFRVEALDSLPKVVLVYSHAGLQPSLMEACLSGNPAGLVIAGTGNANLPESCVPVLRRARAAGTHIVRASRTGGGSASRKRDSLDEELNLIVVDDQIPQHARLLLSVALAAKKNSKELQDVFDAY